MKKCLKIGITVLVVIIGCSFIFGSIDKKRALDNKRPIFVVRTAIYKYGGSKDYMGLGYKVIAFNTLCGYKEVKFGSWKMNINDFNQEVTDYCNKSSNIEDNIESKRLKIIVNMENLCE